MNRKYWINTAGDKMVLLSLENSNIIDILEPETRLQLRMKECTMLQYYIFKYLRINLKAEDVFQWL